MTDQEIYNIFHDANKFTPKELLSLWDKLKDDIRTDTEKRNYIFYLCVTRGFPRFFTTSVSMGVLHPVITAMLEESPSGTNFYYENFYEHLARVQGLLCVLAMYPYYYTPEPGTKELFARWEWEGNPVNITHLKRNKCFLTKEDAIAAAKPEQETRLKDALRIGQAYYVPMPSAPWYYHEYKWEGDADDVRLFRRGLVYFSQDEAIARAKRMLADD